MAELHGSNTLGTSGSLRTENKGVHYSRVLGVVPSAVKDASISRLRTLEGLQPQIPEWYSAARHIDRQYLKELINERWRLQGILDKTLGNLQHDINAFAAPLIKTALRTNFKADVNINEFTVQLDVPITIIFGIDTGGSRVRRSTLLEAALHNFEESETTEGAWRNTAGIYRKDQYGGLALDPTITLPGFASLCRSLDIGGQYQQHLKSILLPESAVARQTLQQGAVASEKAAFEVAALIARLKGDISDHAYGKLRQVAEGRPGVTLYQRPLRPHRLSLMGFRMTGIVLFSAVSEPSLIKQTIDALTPDELKFWTEWSHRIPVLPNQAYEQYKLLQAFFANGPQGVTDELARKEDIYHQSRLSGPLIAYIPDDPEHPLKEYSSLTEFMKTLIGQLLSTDYQAFFSRFVAQKDKGGFFARANERFKTFTWHQREPLDMGPWWRETAVENPNAEPVTNAIDGDLWVTLFIERRNKVIADARVIAVPTGDEDAAARFKRLTSYLEIGWNIFNFTAMLVPGLGEAMLGVMVAQMLAEVTEGIEDWSKGDKEEAGRYFNDVLINFAQLAAMGAGHVLPGGAPTAIKPSSFVESLKPVEVAGKERLWNPDLRPYEQPFAIPQHAEASDIGLYRHQNLDLLRLDDKCYSVKQDPATGRHRLQHSSRAQAYQPLLEHNGAGGWKTELDQPLEWDQTKLLRRLGSSVDAVPDESLKQILTVSGVREDMLRRLHVEHETPPAILADTLERFKAHADAEACAEHILAGRVSGEWADLVPRFMTELQGWPDNKAIEIFEGPGSTGASIKEGYADALPDDTLTLTRQDVIAGRLAQSVVGFLDEKALRDMFGQFIGPGQARIDTMRELLAAQAKKSRGRLFDKLYSAQERSQDPAVLLLKSDYPELSTSMAEELLRHAEPEDMRHLSEKKRLPLTLAKQARQAQQQVRLARAYEGLYLDALYNADTARLAFHSLEALPGWPKDLRLEIREHSFDGPLSDSIGPVDAPIRKVLIAGEQGKYEARDALDQHLHGADNLFAAVLHALPDSQRVALGFEIHESARLERLVRARPLARSKLEPMLLANPIRKPAYDPAVMRLRGGMPGYARLSPERELLQRRTTSLYPGLNDEQVETLLERFEQNGGSATQRLTALETEFNRFNATMQRWMNAPTEFFRFSPAGVAEWNSRNEIYKALRQCWQRTGPRGVEVPGIIAPQALVLDGMPLGRHLATMPRLEANFDHVTDLSLRNAGIGPGEEHFLQPFRQVRQLNLEGNRLTRLPQGIGDMRHLTHLFLNDNMIELDALAVARLRKMTQLRWLALQGNPLRLAPDISQMPHLHVVRLNGTGLNSWPVGLFSQPRPRSIFLDLRSNPISQIPEVAPGSFRAELLARTFISREPRWLSEENLKTLKLYIESVGMDPERPYPPMGTLDSSEWGEGISEAQWRANQQIWNAVEDEFHSESFFNEINRLTQSADFRAGGIYRQELTAKVWRMLEAMAEDSELRTKLFSEATAPTQCVDGGTQLFNAMGVEVLVKEACDLIRPDLVEPRLLELARGKSRLDELGAIARKRVAERLAAGERFTRLDAQGNVSGTIDEVEVHLAYMTELAERLDLPWQARGMQFRNIAGVTKEMIEAAFQRITALEEGDLLCARILDQPLWRNWLESENVEILNWFQRRIDAITDLYDALQRRAEGTGLSVTQKAELEVKIKALAVKAGRSENEFAHGRVMTEVQYTQALNEIDTQMKEQMRMLTQYAIDRAGLQRVDIPFTIDPNYSV
ncbi:dermonecrotic toxin domain-containing protein [Pseudomonas sp. 18173]|uniref:dermonecrotic toxin domain-containing protein n=1 Tax=Pseudomonas sp. 18173 TaxID=3390055 RepID=UPI003D2464B1